MLPQVTRLLCGHVHCAHRTPWGGTVATTMPSVAVDLRKEVDAAFDGMPVYFLHVVADDGGPERFRHAFVRGMAGFLECWLLLGVPALITSMLSARGKRLGDIFAGTFVLRERAPRLRQVARRADHSGAVRDERARSLDAQAG